MTPCLACHQDDCCCDLTPVDECGNCGGPIAFAEILACFIHVDGPDNSCSEINVDHLVVSNPLTSH